MAKLIERLSEYKPGRRNTWIKDEWYDGRVWLLEPKDFGARRLVSVRCALHHRAKKKGLKIETRVTKEGIEVEAYGRA